MSCCLPAAAEAADEAALREYRARHAQRYQERLQAAEQQRQEQLERDRRASQALDRLVCDMHSTLENCEFVIGDAADVQELAGALETLHGELERVLAGHRASAGEQQQGADSDPKAHESFDHVRAVAMRVFDAVNNNANVQVTTTNASHMAACRAVQEHMRAVLDACGVEAAHEVNFEIAMDCSRDEELARRLMMEDLQDRYRDDRYDDDDDGGHEELGLPGAPVGRDDVLLPVPVMPPPPAAEAPRRARRRRQAGTNVPVPARGPATGLQLAAASPPPAAAAAQRRARRSTRGGAMQWNE